VPPPVTLEKVGHDLKFEGLPYLAGRLQTSQRLRPTEIGGIQRPEEFPALAASGSLGGNRRGHSILDGMYRNHTNRALRHCNLMGPWLPRGTEVCRIPSSVQSTACFHSAG
jgi:hypothetical protein